MAVDIITVQSAKVIHKKLQASIIINTISAHPGVPYVRGAKKINSENCSTVKTPTITAPFTPRSAYSLGFGGVSNPRYETG